MAGLALALAGCQTREPTPRPRPRPPAARPSHQPAPQAPSAANYVAHAASLDLFEIESAKMALARSASPRIRAFAEMMIRAHSGTSAQLSFAGRRLNLLPPTVMQPAHQALIEQLAASRDFDATYRRQQIAAHDEALRLHSVYAVRGRSPTLRPVAANAAAIIRQHLAQLRRL
ncbi:MAG: DUF4142 domain-containing protein [Sphingomicrobium sp.]